MSIKESQILSMSAGCSMGIRNRSPRISKRAREADAEEGAAEALRRHKSAVDDAIAELVCPITQSLPVDPVTAEDGKVYERVAIAEWLEQQQRSPMTNEAMGVRLLPALQVRNMIRQMVTVGALAGDKVDAWKVRLEEEERETEERRQDAEAVEAARCAAEAGDGEAMWQLGEWHIWGERGLTADAAVAVEWYERSERAGHAGGTVRLGLCYLEGSGVPRCEARGLAITSEGARRGSAVGAFMLGACYADGLRGVPEDSEMARRWYGQVASAPLDPCPADWVEEAAEWLRGVASAA